MERLSAADVRELERLCPAGIEQDVSLAEISQWRIGGKADLIIRPSTSTELSELRAWFHARSLPHIVIGATSNLLFSDKGLRVPCIQIGQRMARMNVTGQTVQAEAGVWVPGLARRLMQAGLTGGEHICGIPGTLGGLICMNGGSQRKGIGNSVVSVESVDAAGNVAQRLVEQCDFAYRYSVFQENGEIITSATLSFPEGIPTLIRHAMLKILAERNRKFPRKLPNCGSVFKSNPAMYADVGPPGAIIERLGLKGMCCGDAQVSTQHANFIVNLGNATSEEVMNIILKVVTDVESATGHQLEVEVKCVEPDGNVVSVEKFALY
jgi:UDP-N-acetylmuramate dehydrogenase